MTAEEKELLEKALRLPPEARAALAGSLIESLEGRGDEETEAAWSREISRRISELDSGRVKTVSWAEARRRILRADAASSP